MRRPKQTSSYSKLFKLISELLRYDLIKRWCNLPHTTRFIFGAGSYRSGPTSAKARARPGSLQQLIRIDIDGNRDVFGEREFIERFADEAAQANNGFATEQSVETELAL